MLKFIPVDEQNIKHNRLLESISSTTQYLGDITKYRFNHNPNHIYGNDFIVCRDDELIGYLGVTNKVDTKKGSIVSIYYAIDSKFYGNGYGKNIVDTVCIVLSTAKDIDYVIANVDNSNENGIRTIEKCNFNKLNVYDDETQYISRKLR